MFQMGPLLPAFTSPVRSMSPRRSRLAARPEFEDTQEEWLQLLEYFDGDRKVFHVPLSLQGTPFQMKVWNAISEIPLGATMSYGELAGGSE